MRIIKFLVTWLLVFQVVLWGSIGKITATKGDVKVLRDGQTIVIKNGFELAEKDTLTTGQASSVQVVFQDQTVVTIGAMTTFRMQEYMYDNSAQSHAKMSVSEGVFKTITGKIGKLNPQNFKFETKSSSIGIRGTNFQGVVPSHAQGSEYIACTRGGITVTPFDPALTPVNVNAGFITILSQGSITPPRPYTPSDLKPIEQAIQGSTSTESSSKPSTATTAVTTTEKTSVVTDQATTVTSVVNATQNVINTYKTEVTDTTPPATPTISGVSGVISNTAPIISGSAEAGSSVEIYNNGVKIATVTADSHGYYSYTPTSALSDGSYLLSAKAIDKVGNTSSMSGTLSFSVDTITPTPTISGVSGVISNTAPTISGSAEAGSSVEIYNNGVKIATVTADSHGYYSYTPTSALSDGSYLLSAKAIDKVGNTSSMSGTLSFSVDTQAPVIRFTSSQPPLNSVAVSVTGATTVTAKLDGLTLDTTGPVWSLTPDSLLTLNDGGHTLLINARDSAGNIASTSLAITSTHFPDYFNYSLLDLLIDFLTGDDHEDYADWGYWTASTTDPVTHQPQNIKGYWIAGEKTPQSVIDALVAHNTHYTYQGNVVGDVVKDGTSYAILKDEYNNIKFKIRFGEDNPVQVERIRFNTTSQNITISTAFDTTGGPRITTNAFSATANHGGDTLNLTNGKFYGPNATTAAGEWQGSFGTVTGSGIFKANAAQ